MSTVPEEPRRRRRGAELESALLAAAWAELVESGYARLTMESVAARAHTSEPVLYRRWPNKDRLVMAALEHQRAAHPVEYPDTGSLRGDLIAYLTAVSEARAGFFAITVAASLAGLLADADTTPAQVRDEVLGRDPAALSRVMYQRAEERGEIDLGRIPQIVLEMPFDMVRHDLLMRMGPADPARIRGIVDEIFLPLVLREQ